MKDLKAKNILVTGASSGIGEAFAKAANSPFQNYESKPFDTPENSAKVGIEAFLKGKNTVISGQQKFLVSFIPRIFTRLRVIKLTATQYKK